MKITLNDIKYLIEESVRRLVNEAQGEEHPAVYVGTYGKYNNGSLYGEWINLDDFSDCKEFYQYCRKLHADEGNNAEFMFQDYEYVPSIFIGESWISERFWDFMNENKEYSYDVKCAVADHCSDVDEYFNVIDNIVLFSGCDDMTDVAYSYIDDGIYPQSMHYYFDFEQFGRDESMDGPYNEENESIYEEFGVEEDDDKALGEEIINQMYGDIEKAPKELVQRYFDFKKFGEALESDGTWVSSEDGMIEIL